MACENCIEVNRDSCVGCPYRAEVKVNYSSLDFAETEINIPVYEGTKRVA